MKGGAENEVRWRVCLLWMLLNSKHSVDLSVIDQQFWQWQLRWGIGQINRGVGYANR